MKVLDEALTKMKAIDEALVKAMRAETLVDLLSFYIQHSNDDETKKVDQTYEALLLLGETIREIESVLANTTTV